MSGETLPEPNEKFLFNAHNFDAPEEIDEADLIPSYSQEELAAAQAKAFKKGKQEGIDEVNASLNKRIADILNQITQNYPTLLVQEDERAKLYEDEALRLTSNIFETLYPLLKTHLAETELKDKIKEVMEMQEEQSHIAVTVHPEMVAPIQEMLDQATENSTSFDKAEKNFVVHGLDSMDMQAMTMKWKDGGATYNAQDLAQKIQAVIEESLAPLDANSHDNGKEIADSITEDTATTPDSDTDGAIDNE